MDKGLPIIYVRGYAGRQSHVESTVDLPYYGFNLGSTKISTGPEGDPEFLIFESPLVRLMKDHEYADYFARIGSDDEVEILKGQPEDEYPRRSLWIYRYYDVTSRTVGEGERDDIETLASGLGKLVDYVRDKTGAPKVYLVAHSMGGLVCRSLIQREWQGNARDKIARLFTYGTPHGGIHFRRGMGFMTTVRDLFGFNDADTFGPRRMRQYLGFPNDWDESRLHEIGNEFPVSNVFSLIGTNHTDYNLARLAVGPGSDGLVQIDNAYVKGSSRAFIYRAHSGPLGIVNSEEGYQNLQRFLFGDTSVEVVLADVRLKDKLRDDEDLHRILIETKILIRGEEIVMTDQREEHGSAISIKPRHLEDGEETLFRTYLMRTRRADSRERYSYFQLRVSLLPHYVRNRRVLRDRHFMGEHLFQDTLTIGIRDADAGEGRLVRAGWVALESELPSQGTRHTDADDIRFKLQGKNIASGDLVFKVRSEET